MRSKPPEKMRCAVRFLAVTAAFSALLAGGVAHAAKWNHGCPSTPLPMYPSKCGAVTAPFVHPGHELAIVLSDDEVAETGGGFSTAPGGNTVAISFASLFGDPIALPPINVAAVSTATLYFTFPDTQALLGRVLAGPVAIKVTTGDRVTAEVTPKTLVALPPSNDVTSLMLDRTGRDAVATLDARGSIWIPLSFSRLGAMPMPMPGCPDDAVFTHVNAFAVGVDVRANVNVAADDGSGGTYPPLRSVRRADVFIGDFQGNGGNVYGAFLRRMNLLRVPRGFGVSVCAVNDAVNIVLRARGKRRWAEPGSAFTQWVSGSRPLEVTFADVTADENVSSQLQAIQFDGFGTACLLQ